MAHLLFPGRHIVNTMFQEDEIGRIVRTSLDQLEFLGEKPNIKGTIDTVVIPITSYDQQNSRYNPIPGNKREVGVDRFARALKEKYGIKSRIVPVPHYPPSDRFAEITLKEIAETTGDLKLTPENTVVFCSTPSVANIYHKKGFSVLPGELESITPEKYKTMRPVDLVNRIGELGEEWSAHDEITKNLSEATLSLWQDNPEIIRKLLWLYKDPLLTEQGDLTETRDYVTYGYGMSNNEIIKIKYNDIKHAIKPGKIVDEGCADGALLSLVAKDFPDSDLLGLEITGEFVDRFNEMKKHNAFGGSFAYCHQRNIMEAVFENNSIDTTICNSTIHELWSYGNQEETVRNYLANKFKQTREGGRLVIRDVVGPEDKNQTVYMKLNKEDGLNENIHQKFNDHKQLKRHLDRLSTYAKFKRFAVDYLSDMRERGKREEETKINYQEEEIGGQKYIKLRLRDAVEFMTKKDYTDNWKSELNEEFAFWSFSQYKRALTEAGFKVMENPNEPNLCSRAYTNPWIEDNRWKDKVSLYRMNGPKLERMENPVTNMALFAEKKAA